ncbi:hypothetical protein AAW30_00353 [Arcobacter porcinus]|uniref:hypothetical protein n=1 Tax=Arcobacter porcinus TaxID=1935204 RepID=UPI000826649D|nr:hypothetical protein [Arcobacter porcinus]OCL85209.1 hypothetical protein AAW30_00353 [Arcobacter porcinus]
MIRRKRRKGFLEDFLLIFGILAISFAIYFFVFSDNESSETQTATAVTKEKRFLSNLYSEIKEYFFSNLEKDERLEKFILRSKNELENDSSNTHLNYTREDFLSIKDEAQSTNQDKEELISNNIVEDNLSNENIDEKNSDFVEVQNNIIEKEQEELNIIVEENEEKKKVSSNYKKDENSLNTKKASEFFANFRKKVYQNIKNNIPASSLEKGKDVNIRVTILKNGGYEELIFVDGSIYNYGMIKDQIEAVFPLQIDKSIEGIFPRYYRMKINF